MTFEDPFPFEGVGIFQHPFVDVMLMGEKACQKIKECSEEYFWVMKSLNSFKSREKCVI